MTQSLVTVVLFIVLMGALPFLLKRLQQRRGALLGTTPGQPARMVATVAVGPQQRVVTVEVGPEHDRTWLVLGVTAQSINCLHALSVKPVAVSDA